MDFAVRFRADGLCHSLHERPVDQLGRGGPHVPRRMEQHRHRRPRWPGEERFVRSKDGGYRLAAYGKVAAPGETSGIAYAVDPVPSWQDMVLYEHKRMLETFADGIYFDDYFLVPNYNPLGPGYVDDRRPPAPGRELVRLS